MTDRHKFFISYHHENDQYYKNKLVELLGRAYNIPGLDHSVGNHRINSEGMTTERIMQIIRDDYIRDATVTIVLFGTETYKRKFVDWEIRASLRNTKHNPRCGLLGLRLPTRRDHGASGFDESTVQEVFADNNDNGYAQMYDWTDNYRSLADWVHKAYLRRNGDVSPTFSSEPYGRNRS